MKIHTNTYQYTHSTSTHIASHCHTLTCTLHTVQSTYLSPTTTLFMITQLLSLHWGPIEQLSPMQLLFMVIFSPIVVSFPITDCSFLRNPTMGPHGVSEVCGCMINSLSHNTYIKENYSKHEKSRKYGKLLCSKGRKHVCVCVSACVRNYVVECTCSKKGNLEY